MAHIFRIGHTVFKKLDQPVLVFRTSISPGFDLHSESGRTVHIDNVTRARTLNGQAVLVAPNGAVVEHPEHGILTLPEGVFTTEAVRDARSDEVRARTMEFALANQTRLNADQLD